MASYLEEVQKGMDLLASNPKTIFVGQAMEFKGHAVSRQVNKYPKEQLLEMPVMENAQAGICLGLAIEGFLPVSIYPRFDFAILACDQIFNHIDRWESMFAGNVKVIIKILVGTKIPLDGGVQHTANYSEAFASMARTIEIYELTDAKDVFPVYKMAMEGENSVIIIEHTQLYA